jgi:hypothetical protein
MGFTAMKPVNVVMRHTELPFVRLTSDKYLLGITLGIPSGKRILESLASSFSYAQGYAQSYG